MSTIIEAAKARPLVGLSTSERRLYLLIGCLLASLLGCEALSRVLHDKRPVTLRIEAGVEDALAIRKDQGRRQVLVAGNSLVFEGVSGPELQRMIGAGSVVHTAGIPGSTYFDWQYGLRGLLARGAEPDLIVFGISPSQFLRAPAVTPLPVSKLWQVAEIWSYYRQQRPGLTSLSELFLEHFSTFFYMRNTLRIYSRKIIPGYEVMVDQWRQQANPAARPLSSAETEAILHARLLALQEVCGGHAALVLIVVPTNQEVDEIGEEHLRHEAAALGIPMIGPVGERQWPLRKFQPDKYHLTPKAAIEFSALAGTQLAALPGRQK